MSFLAKVFLIRTKKGVDFLTAWIEKADRIEAIKQLNLTNKKPDDVASIAFEGDYEGYKIGKKTIYIQKEVRENAN